VEKSQTQLLGVGRAGGGCRVLTEAFG
jgi:hypothetical protein